MTKFDKIRDLHNFFLKKFRPRKKVVLRFSNRMICNGSYSYYNNKHYITLNKMDNYAVSTENILHEWGHLLDRTKWSKEHHGNCWGICFARVYRVYLEWVETFD